MIGICFGHQIIAHAMGGKVVKVEQGFGIGAHEYKIVFPKQIEHLAQESGLAAKNKFKVNVMHGDQVVMLPDSAEIVASSDFCEFAALYYPEGILTFQGHPEFDNEFTKDLIEYKWNIGQDWVSEATKNAAIASLNQTSDRLQIAKFMLNFLTE